MPDNAKLVPGLGEISRQHDGHVRSLFGIDMGQVPAEGLAVEALTQSDPIRNVTVRQITRRRTYTEKILLYHTS